ncbi:MAG: MJ0042-type zinc finger domain-containing protein, partial [Pseudomonadales bacterium]|nr:MJ0042-type zinc finger domain-containing protein [Pseudomonadales bacterium]
MTDWIVDCPECGTHFRITASHLAAAGGLVRCGACHRVFRASERLRERTARQAVRTDPDRQQAERHRPVLGSSAERDDAVPPMPTADELDAAALAGRPRPGAGEGVAPEPVDPVTHDSEAAGALPFSNEPAGPDRDETLEAAADRGAAAEDALLGEDEFIAGLAEEGPFPRDARDGAQGVEPHAAPDASVDGGDASLDERRDDGATGVEAGPFTLASGDELEQPSALAVEDALEAELDDLLGETPQAVGLSTPLQEAPASRTGGVLGLLESRPATLSERVVPDEAVAAEDVDARAAGGADADAQAAEA